MSDIKKTICKLDRKTLEAMLPIIVAGARQAKYVCRKCGRVAGSKKMLCKPVATDTLESE